MLGCLPALAAEGATSAEAEIQQLIERVETSGCRFHRNGKDYSAQKGAEHLRLKLKRGRKYADSAENFIDRLGSRSSWSGKPYWIESPDGEKQLLGDWLHEQLKLLRAQRTAAED